eukprot:TRINITY_DN58414_c0_g1_i1.p1 TRINITY_DN58414_c0_g1~~TRINITY_DN58414_c0_g1_i1.p1  ORF type:complete len:713 (+),score=88.41 TRINITY_DN58414_c0_g1_i1:117-2255(+)
MRAMKVLQNLRRVGQCPRWCSYDNSYQASIKDKEVFWEQASSSVDWFRKPETILEWDENDETYRWFGGGLTNACHNAVDVHVNNGRADKVALICDNAYTSTVRSYTYQQLLEEVNKCSLALLGLGIVAGDVVMICMPPSAEAVIAMLACARIGAIHNVVGTGLSPTELAKRVQNTRVSCVLTAGTLHQPNGTILPLKSIVDKALQISGHKPQFCIVHNSKLAPNVQNTLTAEEQPTLMSGRDYDWETLMNQFEDDEELVECHQQPSHKPVYIIGGTVYKDKPMIRETGGHTVALKWSFANVLDVTPDSVFFSATDLGWSIAHSTSVYGPLLSGCTTVLLNGKSVKTPDASTLWRIVNQHKATHMFMSPTALHAVKKADPELRLLQGKDISSLQQIFLAGERCDVNTIQWLSKGIATTKTSNGDENSVAGSTLPHILPIYSQTEAGVPMIGMSPKLMATKTASTSTSTSTISHTGHAFPGFEIAWLDANQERVESPKTDGTQLYDMAVALPQPPGMTSAWYRDSSWSETRLTPDAKYYKTGDSGFQAENGLITVTSRGDELIHVNGVRFCCAWLEEIINEHEDVAECVVLGMNDKIRGAVPAALVVLKDGKEHERADVIPEEISRLVKDTMIRQPHFTAANVILLKDELPMTVDGKFPRKALAALLNGIPFKMPVLEYPDALADLEPTLRQKYKEHAAQVEVELAEIEMCTKQ